MNTQNTSTLAAPNIRVATSPMELPEEPRSFNFTGTVEQLTALLAKDSREWDCVEYIVINEIEQPNLWSVWRR